MSLPPPSSSREALAITHRSLAPKTMTNGSLNSRRSSSQGEALDSMATQYTEVKARQQTASALLALPTCIMQNYYMWRGPKPSIPYQNMRRLLEQHWQDI
ncbi:hypothetical protein H257_01669 [Aphanomyces astaci]|uniref:Uncharacterized protein n=1 Tax=Aphanomyces astaci TaxID=112090 RepID=W4H3K7_APHAT|nr:hypothetical protein H257_01669 [Aphanomyces astaci]ETV86487.1 hypothetical protein H257_01669 [Aphanomyces astaci]|eukprot:XP_009823286.1 hypothetical protein H257_01669 [Aphanomyces astaci]